MSRVNYRNLPEAMKTARAKPKPRLPNGTSPRGTVGAITKGGRPGGGLAGMANAVQQRPQGIVKPQQAGGVAALVSGAQNQQAMIQQPAAGGPANPVAPTNQIIAPGGNTGGTAGKAMRGNARVGGGAFRSRRK